MRLGFAVKVLGDGGMPSHDARRWQSGPHLRVSLGYLDRILDHLDANDIRMYRMATALAPYASHPDMPRFWTQVEECAEELAATGAKARALGVRLSVHPGQYTVLNSQDERIVRAAAAELEVQAAVLDAMGQGSEAVVVLHVGGAAGGVDAGLDRFCRGLDLLSERARARLVVENDDHSFGLADVLDVHRRAAVPVVWDILHHHCHDPAGIPDDEALRLAFSTWPPGVLPKIHYSSPKTTLGERKVREGRRVRRTLELPRLRTHADLVDPIGFEAFLTHTARELDFDVMLEAKGKDVALLRLREQLHARGIDLRARAAGPAATSAPGGRRSPTSPSGDAAARPSST